MISRERIKQLYLKKTDDLRIQLFRSTQGSVISYIFDLGSYLIFVNVLNIPYLLARFISYAIGTTVSYFFSILWIFPSRSVASKFLEYGSFLSVGIIGAAGNIVLLAIFTEVIGLYHVYGNVISGILVFFFNFFIRKILLFRKSIKD